MRPFLEQMQEFQGASAQTAAIYAALEQQLGKARAAQDDFFAQLDLETATWALPMWERAYGLEVEESKPHAYRRERVKARMREQGTTTAAMLRNVAESFTNGAVEVEERPGERRVILWYGGTEQAPENVRNVHEAVEKIIPAHIIYSIAYHYEMKIKNCNVFSPYTIAFMLAANALGIEAVRLNGTHRLDGVWQIRPLFTRTLCMAEVEYRMYANNGNTAEFKLK